MVALLVDHLVAVHPQLRAVSSPSQLVVMVEVQFEFLRASPV
jgi:hypothetical protein